LKLRGDLSKQCDDIVKYERQVGRDQDKVKSDQREKCWHPSAKSLRITKGSTNRRWRFPKMFYANRNKNLLNSTKAHQQKEGQLAAQESLMAAMVVDIGLVESPFQHTCL
jgi:hypothetical protein